MNSIIFYYFVKDVIELLVKMATPSKNSCHMELSSKVTLPETADEDMQDQSHSEDECSESSDSSDSEDDSMNEVNLPRLDQTAA